MPDLGRNQYKFSRGTTDRILDLLCQMLDNKETVNLLRKLESEWHWTDGNGNISLCRSMQPLLYQMVYHNRKFEEKLRETIVLLLEKLDAGDDYASTSGGGDANLEQSFLEFVLRGVPSNLHPESIPVITEYLAQEPWRANFTQGTEEGEQNTQDLSVVPRSVEEMQVLNKTNMLEAARECCLEVYLALVEKVLTQMEEDAATPESEDEWLAE